MESLQRLWKDYSASDGEVREWEESVAKSFRRMLE
jgi:hypothetical protein